jgi:hypothetical protein
MQKIFKEVGQDGKKKKKAKGISSKIFKKFVKNSGITKRKILHDYTIS